MTLSGGTVRLRLGVPVHSRGDGLIQVGGDSTRRVLLPETRSIRQLLHVLAVGVSIDRLSDHREALRTLEAAGLLVREADRRLLREARADTTVTLLAPELLRDAFARVIALSGVRVRMGQHDLPSQAVVLMTIGEPERNEVDQLMAGERPVLLVSLIDARIRVGPFIQYGNSACLRCLDAHLAPTDPWAAAALSTGQWPRSTQELGDLNDLQLHQAMLCAARDLAAWGEGRQPITWSTVRWHDERLQVEQVRFSVHPQCGCAWSTLATG